MSYFYRITYLFLFIYNFNTVEAQIPAPNLFCIKGDTVRWDVPVITCGAFQAYELYAAQNFNGPYSLLSSITNQSQTEFIYTNSPGGIIYYYMRSIAACGNQTSLHSDTLDSASPLPVNIEVVSVYDNDIQIFWTEGISPETNAYIIYKGLNGGAVQPIDTVTTLSYTDLDKSTSDSVYTYYITALDRCGGTSVFSPPHATMLLGAAVDTCTKQIKVNFSPYVGWPGTINYYVLVSLDGGPEYIAGTTSGSSFTIEDLQDNSDYCIRIQANEPGQNGLSYSNQLCLHSKVSKTINNLCIIEFNPKSIQNGADSSFIKLITNEDIPLVDVFYQQTSANNLFATVAEQPVQKLAGLNEVVLEYNDTEVQYFRAVSLDACGFKVYSNYVSNIVLSVTIKPNNEIDFNWNAPEWENASVRGYRLERVYSNGSVELVSEGNSGFNSYKSTLEEGQDQETRYCYRVTAFMDLNCDGETKTATTSSNVDCFEKTADVFMPNAFIPGGYTPEFIPVFIFKESLVSYEMVIYDRYGGKVFTTRETEKGWDGNKGNQQMPNGSYTYKVILESGNGSRIDKIGSVNLIR